MEKRGRERAREGKEGGEEKRGRGPAFKWFPSSTHLQAAYSIKSRGKREGGGKADSAAMDAPGWTGSYTLTMLVEREEEGPFIPSLVRR